MNKSLNAQLAKGLIAYRRMNDAMGQFEEHSMATVRSSDSPGHGGVDPTWVSPGAHLDIDIDSVARASQRPLYC